MEALKLFRIQKVLHKLAGLQSEVILHSRVHKYINKSFAFHKKTKLVFMKYNLMCVFFLK